MMKKPEIFKKLTAYDHFMVFLLILSVLKITDVFIDDGKEAGLHFIKLGVALFVISSAVFLAFKYALDRRKKYQHAVISTLIILLVLSHADLNPVRGVLVILLLYISKFLIKYKKQNIFNPVVFAVGMTTLFALFIPSMDIPPLDWSGIDIRFSIFGTAFPLPLLFITLSLIFNVGRVRKHPLALSFIASSLLLGFVMNAYAGNSLSYILSTAFIGSAIIVEPKTSPTKIKQQIIYGVTVAMMILGLSLVNVPNATILGLLIGNVFYFIYKRSKLRNPDLG
ncbi:MAG: hypothetical protein KAS29_20105 [Bacteroidales bacterium]|nr:hypothetical protein [Bacteroidales bacterium]